MSLLCENLVAISPGSWRYHFCPTQPDVVTSCEESTVGLCSANYVYD